MKKLVTAAIVILLALCLAGTVSAETYDYSVSSYSELADVLYYAAYSLKSEFTIHFESRSLYRSILDDFSYFNEAEESAGIYSAYEWWYTDESMQIIGVKDIVYYPGARMAWAWATGDTSFLTSREKDALKTARSMLATAQKGAKDEIEVEKAIHNALIKKVTYDSTVYSDGALHERDTAIGALLNGKADCDGYADAFYLLCYMAGFDVRYMHVDELTEPGTHMLNQIQLSDGKWYLVDVTWDDVDKNSIIMYRCFNIDAGLGSYFYDWKKELFSNKLASNGSQTFPRVYYRYSGPNSACANLSEAGTYMKSVYSQGVRHVLFAVKGSFTAKQLENKVNSKKHYYWSWQRYGYTYFEVYWY